ncbi:hypothetical protein N656DRAFT_316270 [Canariomyces notabilis]|uniref:Uncharacterized protein n=1 Tax=Canariomyces notabilis TaxID=2074819 RepID=A0AAN6QGH5_9PEZI|nr:hypothetical protein N656DRAFT_316270 [Canariomyces arenarius]
MPFQFRLATYSLPFSHFELLSWVTALVSRGMVRCGICRGLFCYSLFFCSGLLAIVVLPCLVLVLRIARGVLCHLLCHGRNTSHGASMCSSLRTEVILLILGAN